MKLAMKIIGHVAWTIGFWSFLRGVWLFSPVAGHLFSGAGLYILGRRLVRHASEGGR